MTARQDYAAEQARILAARVTAKVVQKAAEEAVEPLKDSEATQNTGGHL